MKFPPILTLAVMITLAATACSRHDPAADNTNTTAEIGNEEPACRWWTGTTRAFCWCAMAAVLSVEASSTTIISSPSLTTLHAA